MEYSSRQMHCGWHEQATVQCSIVNAITTGCLSHRMTAGGAAKLSCGATATCSMSGSHAVVASLAWGGDRVGSEHQLSLHTCFCIVPRCGLVSESCLAFNGRSSCRPAVADGHVQPADAGTAATSGAAPEPAHLPGHCAEHHRQVRGAAWRSGGTGRSGHGGGHRLH